MQRVKKWSSLWLVASLLTVLLGACSSEPGYPVLPAGSTVLAFGDSVTYGTGAADGQDYPTLLAQATDWKVINAGIPGDTAQQARSRLQPLLEQHQPALVIIELGGNDFLRKRRESAVQEDLHHMIEQSQSFGAITVLVAVPRLSLLRAGIGALSDSDIYQELAERTAVILVPDLFSDILSDETLQADAVHPNAAGYKAFTTGLIDVLRERGLLAASH